MKYQVRIKDIMSDKPASELFDSLAEAEMKLEEVKEEIRSTWATPDENAAYITSIMDPRTKYDKSNTKMISIKLNRKTDADILEALEREKNVQGFIKNCIRKSL